METQLPALLAIASLGHERLNRTGNPYKNPFGEKQEGGSLQLTPVTTYYPGYAALWRVGCGFKMETK